MRLSSLQKHVLIQCYLSKNSTRVKVELYNFYSKKELEKNLKNVQDIVHKSLESLTEKDLVIAYGRKTAQKWFIEKIKLTSGGRRLAKELIIQKQRKLPIK